MTSKKDIEAYLAVVRQLVEAKKAVIVTRPINQDGLLELGLTSQSAIQEVRALTVSDYTSGPEGDRDRAGQECWVFGCDVAGRECYVKLVVKSLEGGRQRLSILSFHPARWPLNYPFQ